MQRTDEKQKRGVGCPARPPRPCENPHRGNGPLTMLIGVVTPSTWEPLAILKWERMGRAEPIRSTLELTMSEPGRVNLERRPKLY